MKSWTKWISNGDKNTKCYHATTLIRRNRSKIVLIKDNLGSWISDSNLINLHFQKKFKNMSPSCKVLVPLALARPFIPTNDGEIKIKPWSVWSEHFSLECLIGKLKKPWTLWAPWNPLALMGYIWYSTKRIGTLCVILFALPFLRCLGVILGLRILMKILSAWFPKKITQIRLTN